MWDNTNRPSNDAQKGPYITGNAVTNIIIVDYNTSMIHQLWSLFFDYFLSKLPFGNCIFPNLFSDLVVTIIINNFCIESS